MRETPKDEGRENAPETGAESAQDRAAAIERRTEASERLARAEAADMVKETKERIADALWEQPAAFAEYAAAQGPGGPLSRFLEAFSKLDDEALATDALRRAREAAAKASREGEAA